MNMVARRYYWSSKVMIRSEAFYAGPFHVKVTLASHGAGSPDTESRCMGFEQTNPNSSYTRPSAYMVLGCQTAHVSPQSNSNLVAPTERVPSGHALQLTNFPYKQLIDFGVCKPVIGS
jgi:hypothetical protein